MFKRIASSQIECRGRQAIRMLRRDTSRHEKLGIDSKLERPSLPSAGRCAGLVAK